jgi:REP element-mobilizing transposase RayT
MVIRRRLATAQALSSLPVSHPKRYYGSGDLHFITAGCYHRQPFLGTAGRRDLFLRLLERMRRRYRFAVLGYVVMPEHFHLLVSEPQLRTLSTVMQALKLGFSRRWLSPRRALLQSTPWPLPRRIWQARFYDFNVWTEPDQRHRYSADESSLADGMKDGFVVIPGLAKAARPGPLAKL